MAADARTHFSQRMPVFWGNISPDGFDTGAYAQFLGVQADRGVGEDPTTLL